MNDRRLAELAARQRALLTRARVDAVQDGDSEKLQRLRMVLFEDVLDARERIGEYGLASIPLAGAEGIVGAIGGSLSHAIVLAVDDRRYRPTDLEAGEVALYTDEGPAVALRRSRLLELLAQTLDATIDGDATVTAGGDVDVVADQGATVEGLVTAEVTAPATTVEGTVSLQLGNGATVTINASGAITIQGGSVAIIGSSITLNGIDWDAHKHEAPPGSGNYTGPPE